ncbi:MAG: heme NO-binding domain-containing protein [Pseudomonadota bacterium]|nr:heme NO-binding domain-containing protein [Pseudomonadota bacterium]
MKGVVFTEFLEMVEERFSPEIADRIIDASDLPSGGVYTSIGTYDHTEMVQLVSQLSTITGTTVPILVHTFGKYLFSRFVALYPQFFAGVESAFPFLERIDGYIHVEVLKLYPDAELPRFECDTSETGRLTMIYRSTRGFADLAEGLMQGCIDHYGENITIQREDLSGGSGTCVRFLLTKPDGP